MPKYRANVGMNYPDPKTGEDVRVEAGEPLDYLPAPWVLEQGHVSVDDETPATEPATPPAGG